MGYSLFVCRVTGKINTDANAIQCEIYTNKRNQQRWRINPNGKYLCAEDIIRNRHMKQNTKPKITEEEYNELNNAIRKFGKYISSRIITNWGHFWELVDQWTDDRDNKTLIDEINTYTYGGISN